MFLPALPGKTFFSACKRAGRRPVRCSRPQAPTFGMRQKPRQVCAELTSAFQKSVITQRGGTKVNIFSMKGRKERPDSLEHKDSPNYFWTIGLIISVLMAVLILVGYVWTPYNPTEMSGREKFLGPCLTHPLGTDNFGRDLLSRIMEGAGSTFFIALCVILIGGIIGTIIGCLTGYFGGMADVALMRICDAITAFPSILLALVLIAVIGMGKYQVILILGIQIGRAHV